MVTPFVVDHLKRIEKIQRARLCSFNMASSVYTVWPSLFLEEMLNVRQPNRLDILLTSLDRCLSGQGIRN
jgi:hypothetical protein